MNHPKFCSVTFLLEIINSISDPIFVKDRQHSWVLLNDAFCSFIGYSREYLLFKSDHDLLPKQEADTLWEKDELVFTTGIKSENEDNFTDAFGVTHTISTSKSLFEDHAGEKFILVTISKITQNQQFQTQAHNSLQNVEHKQAKDKLALAYAEMATLVFERTKQLVQINEALQAEIKEHELSQAQLRQQTLELEQALVELQRTQIHLVQSAKMSSLGQLVAGIAHEINNPVNFIYGNLSHTEEYIQDLLALLESYQKHYPCPVSAIENFMEEIELDFLKLDLQQILNSMKVGTERIRSIVLSLRTFSRLDEAEMKTVDIHQGIDSTLMILQSRLNASSLNKKQLGSQHHPGIEVIKEYSHLPMVECYAGQLNQVFMNILCNAIDALEEGVGCGVWGMGTQANSIPYILYPTPQIHIRTQLVEPNQITIRIADNGVGIPESIKGRIFDPFFTTKPIGGGTGLGLSICYQIVTERHGGSLQCLSEPGQGSEFIITIPQFQRC